MAEEQIATYIVVGVNIILGFAIDIEGLGVGSMA